MEFRLSSRKPFDEYEEAKALGIETKPVLIGPLTLPAARASARTRSSTGWSCSTAWSRSTPRCSRSSASSAPSGCRSTSRCWSRTAPPAELEALERAYTRLGEVEGAPEDPRQHLLRPRRRGVPGADAAAGRGHRPRLRARRAQPRADPRARLARGQDAVRGRRLRPQRLDQRPRAQHRAAAASCAGTAGDDVVVSTSCSLLHSPDRQAQRAAPRRRGAELDGLRRPEARRGGDARAGAQRGRGRGRRRARRQPQGARRPRARRRAPATRRCASGWRRSPRPTPRRQSPFAERREAQHQKLGLPLFPTTTIGSFPQTAEIRQARIAAAQGRASTRTSTCELMRGEIERVVRLQEEIGLDVLVHGEPERNDMVQYFAEQLDGYVFTENGWVQSYGSRYVRPPILFGDVSRPNAMTVDWAKYAQSLTDRPVKGMLTGPVTMLMWSFVRDDQPRSETCKQLALAIRDEVADLEAAGIEIIQVDEPAIREGLPLRRDRWDEYLDWAVLLLPARDLAGARRDADPDAHVLLGVRRHHAADPGDGRRRAADRGRALEDGAARGLEARRATRTRSAPASTTSTRRASPRPRRWSSCCGAPREVLRARAALGRPRLRPQDAPLRGGRAVAARTWWRRRSSCAKSSSRRRTACTSSSVQCWTGGGTAAGPRVEHWLDARDPEQAVHRPGRRRGRLVGLDPASLGRRLHGGRRGGGDAAGPRTTGRSRSRSTRC